MKTTSTTTTTRRKMRPCARRSILYISQRSTLRTKPPQPQPQQLLLLFLLVVFQLFVTVDALAYAPNFITKIVASSLSSPGDDEEHDTSACPPAGSSDITTRFPPEPNGYLHLGHAKAVSFNFAVAQMFGGSCHMRLDDTNPEKEDSEYVSSILEDVRWLRSSPSPWSGPVRKTSDYFDLIYRCAEHLILQGDAYVEELTAAEMREYRGSLTAPGRDSPWRDARSPDDNLRLFRDMRAGRHAAGSYVLRAKIDMANANLNLRDPTLYRILHQTHQATGDAWCIYPMYDFSHPISDAVEGVTHSLCTLEFEDHRPLYEWTVDKTREVLSKESVMKKNDDDDGGGATTQGPRQIEFSRLNIKNTILSKRKLIQLVNSGVVSGWDDPRMPTLSGVRRRGVPSAALRLFCERVGISKSDSNIDYADLENCVREVMDDASPRAFAVLDPLKVTLINWDGNALEDFDIPRHPKYQDSDTSSASQNTRTVPFGKHLYIERDDFFDTELLGRAPPKGFKRLSPGQQVRLKFAYVVQCDEVVRDPDTQRAVELRCRVFPETRAGFTPPGTKRVAGIIHWVNAQQALPLTVQSYDRLFTAENPGQGDGEPRDYLEDLNPDSWETITGAYVEPSVAMDALHMMARLREQEKNSSIDKETTKNKIYPSELSYQFERLGYFALDKDSSPKKLIFNRVVTLRDTWAKKENKKTKGKNVESAESSPRRRGGSGGKSNNNNNTPLADHRRVALRAGTILSARAHPEADALLVLSVDCGDRNEDGTPAEARQVVAGLAGKISVEDLVQQKVVCLTNLKPAKMRGVESRAMLLAAATSDDDDVRLLAVPEAVPNGELITFEGLDEPEPDVMLKSKGAVKVWDRVKAQLKTNSDGEAAYWKDGIECCRMKTITGESIITTGLKDVLIG